MKRKFSILFYDVLLLTGCYLILAWIKPSTIATVLPHYSLPFAGYLLIWVFVSYFTDKYDLYKGKKIKDQIVAIIISDFAALGVGTFAIYTFKLNVPSRLIVIGTFLACFLLEIILSIVYIYTTEHSLDEEPDRKASKKLVPTIFPDDQYEITHADEHPYLPFTSDKKVYAKLPFIDKLRDIYLKDFVGLFGFIAKNIALENASKLNTLVLNTHTLYNIEKCDEGSQLLFINLHKINDIRRVNRFFIQVNQNLNQNGYFVACMQTKAIRKGEIYKMFPPILNGLIYIFDFIFHRVVPKLPITKQIYFFITRGKNRSLSKAEAFGRLYSCGFEVIADEIISNRLFFIARKVKNPLFGNEPTYGMLVRLNRVGKGGKMIKVYKFRTMHPFSEYLQEYIYKQNSLDKGGKFKDDFRITRWGAIMRKIWLDELPMFINFFKREMKLVGVRPISEHYMSLYTPEHQELRKMVKPGLFPPYYADLPDNIDDIARSEATYIRKYLRHPLYTDFTYFFLIVKNILFKRARSK